MLFNKNYLLNIFGWCWGLTTYCPETARTVIFQNSSDDMKPIYQYWLSKRKSKNRNWRFKAQFRWLVYTNCWFMDRILEMGHNVYEEMIRLNSPSSKVHCDPLIYSPCLFITHRCSPLNEPIWSYAWSKFRENIHGIVWCCADGYRQRRKNNINGKDRLYAFKETTHTHTIWRDRINKWLSINSHKNKEG